MCIRDSCRYRSYDCHRRESGVWQHISPGLQLHHCHQKVLALGQPHLGELHEHPVIWCSHEYFNRPDRVPAGEPDTPLDPLDPQPLCRKNLLRGRPHDMPTAQSPSAADPLAAATHAVHNLFHPVHGQPQLRPTHSGTASLRADRDLSLIHISEPTRPY